jgi:hypothetical protein
MHLEDIAFNLLDSFDGVRLRPLMPAFSEAIRLKGSPFPRCCSNIMSKLRIAVEWSFGEVVNLFAFVDFKKSQDPLLQPVASYWQIAALLADCNSCLYGNLTSQ